MKNPDRVTIARFEDLPNIGKASSSVSFSGEDEEKG